MARRKMDDYVPVIGEDEVYDSGKTQEKCPDCGAAKVWRHGNWNSLFLGCSRYPKCKWASYKTPKPAGGNCE